MKFKKITKSVITESVHPAVEDYRKFAGLGDDEPINESMIDEWALNEASAKHNVQSYDLKHMILGEDVTIDQAARELEADKSAAETKNQVDSVLDRSLQIARDMQEDGDTSDFPNILFESPAGFGKTDMIRDWARKRGINLVERNLGTMGPEVFSGIVARDAKDPDYATRLGVPDLARELQKPNSVLFLDEYNRSKTEIRGAVLTLIQNHKIWDPKAEGSYSILPNFLFTIAAINPSGTVYKGAKEMDPAERSRFFRQPLVPDPMEHLKFLRSFYENKLNNTQRPERKLQLRGRIALAEKILSDPRFSYDTSADEEKYQDTPGYQPLNYRSFKLALDRCDGTKEDLLNIWNHYCNFNKKRVIEDILMDYVDVDDEANAAIKDDSASDVFKKEMSNRDKLRARGFNV